MEPSAQSSVMRWIRILRAVLRRHGLSERTHGRWRSRLRALRRDGRGMMATRRVSRCLNVTRDAGGLHLRLQLVEEVPDGTLAFDSLLPCSHKSLAYDAYRLPAFSSLPCRTSSTSTHRVNRWRP